MAVDKSQKIKVKLKNKIAVRKDVEAQIKELTDKKEELGKDIQKLMLELGEDRFEIDPGVGYNLQRPVKTVFHEDAIKGHLKTVAPKLVKLVFRKVEVFDRSALENLIEAGKLPDADKFLADDKFVQFEDMTPRLMPLTAVKEKK